MRTIARFIAMAFIVFVLSACNLAMAGAPNNASNNTPVVMVGGLSALRLSVGTQNESTEYRSVGEVILYMYSVTNTGTTSLLGPVTIIDELGAVTCPALSMVGNLDDYFDPAESLHCSGSYTITPQDFNNGAITILGTAAVGGVISDVTSITLYRAVKTQSVPLSITQSIAVTPTVTAIASGLLRINFEPGQVTTIKTGQLNPNESTRYVLHASAGQKLGVDVSASGGQIALSVTDPAGLTLKPSDSNLNWILDIRTDGDYFIEVGNLAGTEGSYSMEISLYIPNNSSNDSSKPPDPSTPAPTLNAFDQEEAAIKNQPSASYQYIAPVSLKLDETFIVELHMSRSLNVAQLSTQIVTENELATSTAEPEKLIAPQGAAVMLEGGQVDVTQWMQAQLFSEDLQAFEIRPLHDNAVQFLGANATVKWQWVVKAKKAGKYNLIFVIYQQAITNDIANWHTLDAERRVVQVNVTLDQQIRSLDWKWIAVILIALAAISISLIWYTRRKSDQEEIISRSQTAIGTMQTFLPDSPLARLPRAANVGNFDKDISGNVFISYRRSDSADITGRIYDRLVGVFGRKPIFKDVDSIPLGTDFKEYLDQQVSNCDVFLAIIGDRWIDARGLGGMRRLDDPEDFVRLEIESALEQGIPVIPLLVRGAHMPDDEELPPSLQKLVYKNGIPIRPDPDFHNDMDRLISALEKYLVATG